MNKLPKKLEGRRVRLMNVNGTWHEGTVVRQTNNVIKLSYGSRFMRVISISDIRQLETIEVAR